MAAFSPHYDHGHARSSASSFLLDRQYRCSGDYRALVLKPTDLSWELVTCKDSTSSLIESDADKLGLSAVADDPAADGTGLLRHHLRLQSLTLLFGVCACARCSRCARCGVSGVAARFLVAVVELRDDVGARGSEEEHEGVMSVAAHSKLWLSHKPIRLFIL